VAARAWLFVAVLVAGAAHGGEANGRRLAAELSILAGDVRRLVAGEGGPLEREGLRQRVGGALASLPLTLRRAGADPAPVRTLRDAQAAGDWSALARALARLLERHRFAPPWIGMATPAAATLGGALHREWCAGCHDAPAADAQLPARNLAAEYASMPRSEFAARLWLGVRGTRERGHANPFADEELAALMAWYAAADPARRNPLEMK
jgi:hypothetical protein